MVNENKVTITAKDANELIVQGKQLKNFHITGDLDLFKIRGELQTDLSIENCIIDNLIAPAVKFSHHVHFNDVCFKRCSFNFARFYDGLLIENCEFETYLDFSPGGHNEKNKLFSIRNSVFKEFVSFFDCWFQGDVEIVNNDFRKGTNLLGNKDDVYRVHFDFEPTIKNNLGLIDLDGEGDKSVNTIY